MDPATALGPLQQAPPDRATLSLEQLYNQVLALLFGDRVLDQYEKKLTFDFFEQVQLRSQNGGIGNGGTPPADQPDQGLPQSAMDMNQDTQDMGQVEGAEPMQGSEGY